MDSSEPVYPHGQRDISEPSPPGDSAESPSELAYSADPEDDAEPTAPLKEEVLVDDAGPTVPLEEEEEQVEEHEE
jgi:hypothetical protein